MENACNAEDIEDMFVHEEQHRALRAVHTYVFSCHGRGRWERQKAKRGKSASKVEAVRPPRRSQKQTNHKR